MNWNVGKAAEITNKMTVQDPIEVGIFLIKTWTVSENSPAMVGAMQKYSGDKNKMVCGEPGVVEEQWGAAKRSQETQLKPESWRDISQWALEIILRSCFYSD